MSRKIYPVRKKKYPKENKYDTWARASRTNANVHGFSRKKTKNDDEVYPFTIDTSDHSFQKSETGKKSPITAMRHRCKKINDQKVEYKNGTLTQITMLQNEIETLKNNKIEIKGKINDLNNKIESIISEYNKHCSEEEKMDDGKVLFSCCVVM